MALPGPPARHSNVGNQTGHLTSIHSTFTAARKRAGLDPRIVPYSARHTYATYAVRSTGNIFATSAQMGHADIKSMEPYQHQDLDQLLEAVNQRNSMRSSLPASETQRLQFRQPNLNTHLPPQAQRTQLAPIRAT